MFACTVVTVAAIGLASRVGPVFGSQMLAIRTGSMQPSLPIGSLVVVTDPGRPLRAGQVAAFRLPSGVIVTHRVTQTIARDDGMYYRTRGDANSTADPVLVAGRSVIGRVAIAIPVAGFVLGLLALPSGLAAIASLLAVLYLSIWLLDDLIEADTLPTKTTTLAPEPSRAR